MSANTVPRDALERLARLEQLVDDINRRRTPAPPLLHELKHTDQLRYVAAGQVPVYNSATGRWEPGSGGAPMAWGLSGPLIVTSLLMQRASTGYIYGLVGSLIVVGTTDTVVALTKNGVTVGSVTISALASEGTEDVAIATALDDALVPVVTTAGAGAVGLTFQVR